jgi:hypothetical protein
MICFQMEGGEIIMATDRAHYQAYMLRIWQDQDEPGSVWRALLESPHTGECHGFESLEALFDFLRQSVGQVRCAVKSPLEVSPER